MMERDTIQSPLPSLSNRILAGCVQLYVCVLLSHRVVPDPPDPADEPGVDAGQSGHVLGALEVEVGLLREQ